MNEASRQRAAASEIARLRSNVEAYAAFLGRPAERFLDEAFLSYATGISSPARVRELLDGALPEVEPDEKSALEAFQKALFQQRLRFLRETRLKVSEAGQEDTYPLKDIAQSAGITLQQVSLLLRGERAPNAAHATRLERFFDQASQLRSPKSHVRQGFCLRNEGTALIAHLSEMVSADLPQLALASLAGELGTASLSLRATGDTGEVDLVKLLPVLAQLRDQGPGPQRD